MIVETQRHVWQKTTCVIANGGTTSAAATIPNGVAEVVLQIPTLTSGTLKVQWSGDNSTFQDVWGLMGDSGAPELIVTGATTGAFTIGLSPSLIPAPRYLKVVSGAAQGAARTITVWYR